MTLPSDWKMGKCLEWYTEVPFPDRPRESPVFFIQNVECSFQLRRVKNSSSGYFYYYLYLKPKTSDAKLKSFPLTMYSDYSSIGSFERYDVKFSDSNQYLVGIYEETVKKRGANVGCGYFVKLLFVFGTGDGPSLPLETKSDETPSQLDLPSSVQTDVEYLALDFGMLLKSGDYSDVELQCNGGNIPAHRAILAARSEAFSDMFKENGSQGNLVNLASTEISVMELCLEYVYKGKISKLPTEKVPDLYVLGHALKISSLTRMCADFMISNTTPGEKSTQADLMLSLQTDEECLSLDFGQLLQTEEHSDVQLQCKGGSIAAHRAILAARSRAFSEMFQDGTSESQSGEVNLTATDISVMRSCLEFIYKGKIEEVPIEMAKNLYVLGHDLKIPSLAKKCADLMVSHASEDNYIPYLILADKYNDDHFKRGLGDYVSDHTDLLKTEKWIKFSHEHLKTAVDVYHKCMFK